MGYRMGLAGRRFGHLVVMRLDPEPYVSPSGKHKARRWICQCDCGREVSVVQSSLLSKEHPTKSCGCSNHETRSANALDLTGQRYGRLTVLGLDPEPYVSPSGKNRARKWICRCDCGNVVSVQQASLRAKKNPSRSCGCLRGEASRDAVIDMTGMRFGRWTVVRRAELPKKFSNGTVNGWLCRCDCGTERVIDRESLVSGRSVSCGCGRAEKSSERAARDGKNVFERYDGTTVSAIRPGLKPLKNNTSGVRGVYWEASSQRWVAAIGLRGKIKKLGRFTDKEDAIRARKEAEAEYYAPIIEAYDAEKD